MERVVKCKDMVIKCKGRKKSSWDRHVPGNSMSVLSNIMMMIIKERSLKSPITPGVHLGINQRGGKIELALSQGGYNFHMYMIKMEEEIGFNYQHNN